VALIGDAAHAMYQTGSNRGSQAVVDARVLGAALVEHGVTQEALTAYNAQLCGPISQLVLRNRGARPFGLLNIVDDCGGTFDNIETVIPLHERTAFMAGYRAGAGFAIEKLNKAAQTIANGAHASKPEFAADFRRNILPTNSQKHSDAMSSEIFKLTPHGTRCPTSQAPSASMPEGDYWAM
jgi:5-methylphenazine-1-carboxylate 1-monooxygenase